jgi:precorrin-2 C(20)-methyltransferase
MLTFVGVGPSDPELVTLKAVWALEAADLIALPDSGAGEGAAEKIASRWITGKERLHLPMPMRGEKEDWREAHRDAARVLMEHLAAGRRIAYPVLGDPLLYATSGYLLKLIRPHYACEVIPGVPAMCAAAAALGAPLAEGREKLTILPGFGEGDQLPEGAVVVLKAGRALDAIRASLYGRSALLAQNLGMPGEYLGQIAGADARESYFSTVLIGPGKEP